jgi:hypothetical protein
MSDSLMLEVGIASGMVEAQRGLIAATGITSGVDGEHHHYNSDAVDPRIGDHGSRVGVPGLPACAYPTPCAALVNPVQS